MSECSPMGINARGVTQCSEGHGDYPDACIQAQRMPLDVARTLLRALVWCGNQITNEQRVRAWQWVEATRGPVEEMGQ